MTVLSFPFQFGSLLFLFLAVTRTSNIMFNRSGESSPPCLVPDFSEKAFSFSLLSTMLACGFVIDSFYYVEKRSMGII